jgi:GxxExxY protein
MNRQDAADAKISAKGLVEPDVELDGLAHAVIGAALRVHRALGPGLLESLYERALSIELDRQKIPYQKQIPLSVLYEGEPIGEHRLDLLVGDRLVVELKAIEVLLPVHRLQVRSYLRAAHCTLGLLINFNVPLLRDGIRRVILSPQ